MTITDKIFIGFAVCAALIIGTLRAIHADEYRASMDPVANDYVCPIDRPNKRLVMDLTKPATCPTESKLFCDDQNCIYRSVQKQCTPFEKYAVCLTNDELIEAK